MVPISRARAPTGAPWTENQATQHKLNQPRGLSLLDSARNREKSKGQQRRGKIVSAIFHIFFRTPPHFFTLFRTFSPGLFLK